jgi:adenylate cyclase
MTAAAAPPPQEGRAPQRYHFGAAEVRAGERALLIDGKPAELGARAFDVLLALVENRGRVVTKDELLASAWPGLVVEENNLQQQISTLRKLLGQHAISTIPGRGYQFALAETSPAADVAAPAHDAGGEPLPPPPRTKVAAGIAAACVFAVVAASAVWWYAARPKTIAAAPLSIAVLPFANLSGDPGQGYLADGLTAAITNDLSRIRDAYIVDASTSYIYKNKPVPAQEAGEQLGVRFVLMGSVERDKDHIRFHAQLDDTGTGAQLWSDTFDGDESDLFALQDRVTTRIVNSIDETMVVAAARDSEKRKSSPAAADLNLRAWALLMTPDTEKRSQQMEALYRQALAIEPDNAVAMAGLASTLTNVAATSDNGLDPAARERIFLEAREYALKARAIDPRLTQIYVALGTYAKVHDDFAGYKNANETRLALEPKNPVSYINMAWVYYDAGEPKRVLELLDQAAELHHKTRRHLWTVGLKGNTYFMLGDDDKAIEWTLKAMSDKPESPFGYAMLAMAYARKGDKAKAQAAADNLRRVAPNFTLSELEPPQPSYPEASKEFWNKRLIPAWRLAGLPEQP